MKRFSWLAFLSRGFLAAAILGAAVGPVAALDSNSVRALPSASRSVELSWADATPTFFCVYRGTTPLNTVVVNSTPALALTDTPPAAALFFYAVDEPSSGNCGPCQPSASLLCGDAVSGSNNAAGSRDQVNAYPCSAADLSGPEFAYSFSVSGSDQSVTATLGNLSANLDILLLQDAGSGCDPASCAAAGDTEIAFTAAPGNQYYLVVDGVQGAVGTYDIAVSCAPAVTKCAPVGAVSCGAPLSGSTAGAGTTDVLDAYTACTPRDESGPEIAYTFKPSAAGLVTATLSGLAADLDMLVLEDRGTGCDGSSCIAFGDTATVFAAAAGATYYIVVDGFGGASGTYTLTLDCAPPGCSPLADIQCGVPVSGSTTGPGSLDVINAYPACTVRDESGPELSYRFEPALSAAVTATLSGMTADLDVVVLQDRGAGCRPEDCVAFGDTSAGFAAVGGNVYYVIIDGFQAAAGDFTLTLDCLPNQCAPAASIACGESVTGRNDAPGSTDRVDQYPLCWAGDESGPEMVYSFTPTADGSVTATLTRASANLDLAVLQDLGRGCNPDDCLTAGDSNVVFPAFMGRTYYIVVDGAGGAVGSYDLALTCGACNPQAQVSCGNTVAGRNDAPGSSDAVDFYPVCSARNASGNEFTYLFAPLDTVTVTATLSGMTADLDLFALEDLGLGCDPGACGAWGDSVMSFAAYPGSTYYVVVDGIAGGASGYSLNAQCAPILCSTGGTIACGGTVAGRNDGAQSTNRIDRYPACQAPGRSESGPEIAYRFDSASADLVRATVTPAANDLDVFVLLDSGGGCDPDSCVVWGDTSAQFATVAGGTYYIVVDGVDGAVDGFTLDLSCRPAGSLCNPIETLTCVSFVSGNNGAPGSTNAIDFYDACWGGMDETGPEYTYVFTAPADMGVNLTLSNFWFKNPDILVLEERGGGCDPATCIAAGDFTTDFTATAGTTYYFVVDGYYGDVTDYDLSVSCY